MSCSRDKKKRAYLNHFNLLVSFHFISVQTTLPPPPPTSYPLISYTILGEQVGMKFRVMLPFPLRCHRHKMTTFGYVIYKIMKIFEAEELEKARIYKKYRLLRLDTEENN